MTNKYIIGLYLTLLILGARSSSGQVLYAQPGLDQTKLTQSEVFQFQKEIVDQVLTYNIGYLTLSIGVILGIGVIFSIINFNPLKKKLDKQESDIIAIKKDLVDQQNSTLEKIRKEFNEEMVKISEQSSSLDKLFKQKADELDYKRKLLELDVIWNQHYLWQIASITFPRLATNDLDSLITYLEKSVEFNIKFAIDTCLRQLERVLTELKKELVDVDKQKYLIKIIKVLDTVDSSTFDKTKLLELAKEKLI